MYCTWIAINTHISIYSSAKPIVSGSFVNESINSFIMFIVIKVTKLLTTKDTIIPLATIVLAFSSSFSPRYFATSTLDSYSYPNSYSNIKCGNGENYGYGT